MMRARLVPADGSPAIELTREISVVGRRDDCDVRVDHKSVSKQHCVVVKSHAHILLRDLGSTNGTRVNGQRVRRAALDADDEVCFAGAKFRLVLGEPEPPPPTGRTQQLRPDEVAALVKRQPPAELREPRVQVRTHDLPDVYPPDSDAGPPT